MAGRENPPEWMLSIPFVPGEQQAAHASFAGALDCYPE
jgi:hypothetical protein